MSITGHWRNATGFNTTDYTVIMGKPVAQCSVEELSANPMCGSVSPFANVAYTGVASEMINNNIVNLGGAAPFTYPITSEHSETWQVGEAPSGDIRKQYRRTIFVACPSNVNMPAYFLSENTDSRILIVEDIAYPNKLVINYGNTSDYGDNIYRTVNFKVSNVACKHTCDRGQSSYATAPSQVDYEDPESHTHTYYNIYPVWLYVIEDEAYIVLYEYLCFSGGRYKSTDTDDKNYNFIQRGDFQSFNQTTPKWLALGYNPNPSAQATTLHDLFPSGYADPVPLPAVFNTVPFEYPTTNLAPDGAGVVYGIQMNNNVSANTYVCRLDISLYTGNQWYRANTMCRIGCYFVNNGELLKPIIQDGIVIGYGTPEQESEIDKYTDLKHPVPTGPGGGGGGGDDDDPWHGVDFGGTGAGGGGAFCSVYYMTAAELTSLKNWGMTSSPEGFDMLPSIIGLHQVPVAISGIPTTVKFLKSAAITESGDSRLINTEVSAGTGTGAPIEFSLGSVDINRRMQQRGEPYLDYDCTVELYLPFAGVFQLDTQAVMGRTISAKIVIDPVNGTAFAYAWVANGGEKMPIAYGGGPIAVSLPVSSNQWGLSRAAAQQMKHQQTQNALNIIKDAALSWAGGKMAQNINRMGFSTNVDAQIAQYGTTQGLKYQSVQQGSNIIESTANLVQGIHNLVQLNNTNYTAVNGSFGGSYAEWSQPFTAYVRITRPKFQKPDNYNHTQAVPCVETKTVGSCTGLVQCINPDIDSIPCTQTEKVLITNALVNGVYAGGGGQ